MQFTNIKMALGKQFNTAMLDIVSGDNDLIGIGANKFAELKNNKALEEFFGAEEWNKITEAKELQLAELMIDSNIDLNPTKVVKNRDLLVAAVGTDKADYYTDKAKNTFKRQDERS
jgi:hypothetical protein